MTNLEVLKLKIANMTVEELGEFLDNINCELCEYNNSGNCNRNSCVAGYTAYLKKAHTPTVKQVEKKRTITEIHLMCSCGGECLPVYTDALSTTIAHKCNQCGHIVECEVRYPYTVPETDLSKMAEINLCCVSGVVNDGRNH